MVSSVIDNVDIYIIYGMIYFL